MQIHEELPKDPGSAACARQVLARLTGQVGERALADAQLLVTELVANAVEHVPDHGDLSLDVRPRATGRCASASPIPGTASSRARGAPTRPQDSGWGLHFVDQLADRWAVESGRAALRAGSGSSSTPYASKQTAAL